MIPVGGFDHDRVAHAAMTARRAARMSEVEASRREAEVAIERLLEQWQADDLAGTASAYLWDSTAMEAIDALSSLLATVDLAHGPPLISQRTHS
ncbi:hypothetical protein CFI00_19540 [Nocardioides sp. S5]|uniref:hypothetical protein n=1 Tax=Nocardioides sp. S5 TaxID=2017486 RepID=UPI001A8CEEA2|nr:hypothetical protein [Nocardioides sp. S5]QSR32647.1 hypothetical protein CFI00_19540 [Nocardioides sp. S5]